MNPESNNASAVHNFSEDTVSQRCEQFERRWAVGDTPRIEDFLSGLSASDQSAAFERLLSIELAYRSLSGETISEQDYWERFPGFHPILDRAFRAHESLACDESHLRFQSSTLLWNQIACAVNPAVVHNADDMIDRYRLMDRVGRGGFGEVWKAVDTELGREVAIKLARSDRSLPIGMMDQLRTEARHAASLKHPHIVPVYDIALTPHGTYIVSEFINGETLADRLKRGAMPPTLAVKLTIQIAEALHHAHLRGLVHRDVKPGNILLRATGDEAVLTDFGLAVTEVDQLRENHSTVGTWWYMSPEQGRGESHRVDARSDIYSLGVVLYQLLTGRLPFIAQTREDYLDQLQHRPPRPLRTIDDMLDPELEQICLRCLAKDVADRFSTCSDLANALRKWGEQDLLVSHAPPVSVREQTSPAIRPTVSRRLLVGLVFALLGISAVSTYFWPNIFANQSSSDSSKTEMEAVVSIPDKKTSVPREDHAIDGWRPLMAKEPSIFAWSFGEGREKPRFDSAQRMFAVRSNQVRWIATVGELTQDEFELQAEISVKDWIGSCGMVWQLAVDTRFAPEKAYRCLGVEYLRTSKTTPSELRLKEFIVKEFSYDRRHIEHIGSIAVQQIGTPTQTWVPLKCHVTPERITVWFNDEIEWVASETMLDLGWVPALNATCGITGSGIETKVRGLSVHFVR